MIIKTFISKEPIGTGISCDDRKIGVPTGTDTLIATNLQLN